MRFHHYKGEITDRVSRLEKYIVDLLINSNVPDEKRESSIAFELKHSSNTTQFGKLLAIKRGLSLDVCAAGSLLHDYAVIKTGSYDQHAHKSAEMAMPLLVDFTDEEKEQIYKIIYNHSDKQIWTDDPYVEFGKDVDLLDCFLYTDVLDDYKIKKTPEVFEACVKRAKKVFAELGVDISEEF